MDKPVDRTAASTEALREHDTQAAPCCGHGGDAPEAQLADRRWQAALESYSLLERPIAPRPWTD